MMRSTLINGRVLSATRKLARVAREEDGDAPPDSGAGRLWRALGWVVCGLAPLVALSLTLVQGGKPLATLTATILRAPSGSVRPADMYGLIILVLAAVALAIWGLRPALAALGEGALGLGVIIVIQRLTLAGLLVVNTALAAALMAALMALAVVSARLEWTRREKARLKLGMAREAGAERALTEWPPERLVRMDTFIGLASHELRTPLTTIKASVQLALRKLDRTSQPELIREDLRQLLTRADQRVGRMTRLVEDLLDTSRIASGQLPLRFEQCDLLALTREAVCDAQLRAPARTIYLETDGTPALVWGDPARLAQAVGIYLANALKFSDASQPVEACVWGRWRVDGADGAEVWQTRVAVRDHGPGVKREALARVWDRFYQDPELAAQSGSEVGLGLGLYLCRAIIEAHHGAVGVENVSDSGSLFWFTTPALSE